MCLACGLQKEYGDKYTISELTQDPNTAATPSQ
jgi:hypothetical protein